ncbi:CDGSH iron-sulfur domain-containing protein [Thiorhodococcus fuscus]|uniref:CDGSH iron-sulfur domain-containing protein n=1 Tax=Thiorhodococcus fuscus TaxID=527200 RepID=A0ABW4Y4T8_9GAMM
MSDEQTCVDFPGEEIDVRWDGRLCIHVGECGKAKGDLFVGGREPWCLPDTTTKAEVREVIERCPSGALTYRDTSGEPESPPAENRLMIASDGPYYLTGDLQIEGAPDDMPGVRTRAAICRCGASKNKPFCDGSHEGAGFKDSGAVGDRGRGLPSTGGPVVVRPIKDGPVQVEGKLTIQAGSGRVAWQGENVFLCRCGASKNKPFCDGSHAAAGFKGD